MTLFSKGINSSHVRLVTVIRLDIPTEQTGHIMLNKKMIPRLTKLFFLDCSKVLRINTSHHFHDGKEAIYIYIYIYIVDSQN